MSELLTKGLAKPRSAIAKKIFNEIIGARNCHRSRDHGPSTIPTLLYRTLVALNKI